MVLACASKKAAELMEWSSPEQLFTLASFIARTLKGRGSRLQEAKELC